MKTKQGSQNKKWWKVFLGISAATIVAAGATMGICYAIWHKQKNPETSFNVSCTNPNLTFDTTDELSLTWTSANYTPTNFTLKDGDSNNNWTLINNGNHQLTLTRQSSSLPANVYNVVIQASDDITTNEDTEVVTISNPIGKDLFFTTGDTTTTPNSAKAFYGTISAANFTLCDDANLKVQVNGAFPTGDDTWTAITFDNKTHIKITPPDNLTAGSKFQVAIYDAQNDITSNAIGFSVQAKMTVDDNKYMKITNAGVVTIDDVAATIDVNSESLVGLYFGTNSLVATLKCQSNQLTSLDVSKNTGLIALWCFSNQLTSLDVSKNTNLQTLYCDSNQLTSLDVSNNSQLTALICNSNQLTFLDVSKNTSLTNFRCHDNQLTSLDVSKNTQLTTLYCYTNQLQQLDVSNNSSLQHLYCYSNQLTSLDVSKNTDLRTLYCYSNQLQQLDVSNHTQLQGLDCFFNQLTSLDVSGNSALTNLNCYSNQLTSLDVSGNSALTNLYCYSNPLNLIKLPTNRTSGSFTFASSGTAAWIATGYATTGDIYCNASWTINNLLSTWTRHNS